MKNRTKIKIFVVSIFWLVITTVSCNSEHGIAPKPIGKQEFGFGGNIVFSGEWPDSIKLMVLVVFKNPLLNDRDFVITNMRYLSVPIPLNTQTYQYSSLDTALIPIMPDEVSPSEYSYVAVAQSNKEFSLSRKDFFVAGVYYANSDSTNPGTLTIPSNTYVDNINIYCDFDNPPPQPPGGN